jgi:membrane-bound lytic murein transglycosylase B
MFYGVPDLRKHPFSLTLLVSALALVFSPVMAADTGAVGDSTQADDFSVCVETLKQRARAEGLSEQTIAGTVAKLNYVPRVIELDRQQPEFRQTFANYFNARVTESRIQQGRKLMVQHRELLTKLTKEYGIPPQYLLAFWGLETNFGGYKGKMSVLDSLATLGCDPRRSSYFTSELMQALKLKEKYHFEANDMVGSWAGAMGHTQFMPTNYARYALDGDSDGRVDLWNSTNDALTSAANFLAQLGWKREERWGREVKLSRNFDYQYLGRAQAQSLATWARMGVTQANGTPLSTPDMKAALYAPAGHTGPAFLGYDNFEVIMRWNRSEFYAIAVGHLADRINGALPLQVSPPQQDRLSLESVRQMQERLKELGFDVGAADGVLGSNSIKALRAFQAKQGLIADGYPSSETFAALGVKAD